MMDIQSSPALSSLHDCQSSQEFREQSSLINDNVQIAKTTQRAQNSQVVELSRNEAEKKNLSDKYARSRSELRLICRVIIASLKIIDFSSKHFISDHQNSTIKDQV